MMITVHLQTIDGSQIGFQGDRLSSIGMDFAALCGWRQFYLPGEDILTVDSYCGCADAYAGAKKDTNQG
jgi:hypothetical protein